MFAVLLEHVRFSTDGTPVNMRIESDDTVGEFENLFGLELLFYHPTVGVCCILNGHQIADDMLHGCIQHRLGATYGLCTYDVSRLGEQHAKRHHKDGNSHQEDA